MRDRSERVLKGLLARSEKSLQRFLPEEEQARLAALPPPHGEREAYGEWERLHWSWFVPVLAQYVSRDQKLLLSAFGDHAQGQLRKALSLRGIVPNVSDGARAYFQERLLQGLLEPHEAILPAEFLPTSPLNRLLALTKAELIRLVNFLSLYDLCAELKQIVETKILKRIYSFLSEDERNALKQIALHKDGYGFARLGLERWDGTGRDLHVLLHKRGLARLGVALSIQHPDLIWTICHHLDIGRGGALAKLSGSEAGEEAVSLAPLAIRQVEESLNI